MLCLPWHPCLYLCPCLAFASHKHDRLKLQQLSRPRQSAVNLRYLRPQPQCTYEWVRALWSMHAFECVSVRDCFTIKIKMVLLSSLLLWSCLVTRVQSLRFICLPRCLSCVSRIASYPVFSFKYSSVHHHHSFLHAAAAAEFRSLWAGGSVSPSPAVLLLQLRPSAVLQRLDRLQMCICFSVRLFVFFVCLSVGLSAWYSKIFNWE